VQGGSDRDALLALVAEVVVEAHSVLMFCAGRAAAQSCASMLATELGRLVGPPSAAQAAARRELVEELRVALAGAVNADLERMIGAAVRGPVCRVAAAVVSQLMQVMTRGAVL
jgi:hypothetical protein